MRRSPLVAPSVVAILSALCVACWLVGCASSGPKPPPTRAPRPTPTHAPAAWVRDGRLPPFNLAYHVGDSPIEPGSHDWDGISAPNPRCQATDAQAHRWQTYRTLMTEAATARSPRWRDDPIQASVMQVAFDGDACRGPVYEVYTPEEAAAAMYALVSG